MCGCGVTSSHAGIGDYAGFEGRESDSEASETHLSHGT